jgi:hypothetical protein
MKSLNARIEKLETTEKPHSKLLPLVVDDATTDAELERLRYGGQEVDRLSELLDKLIFPFN